MKCSSAIFKENIRLVLAVLKHNVVLAVVLRGWYNLGSSKPLLEMFYFWSAYDKRKRRRNRKKKKNPSKLMSPRRNQFFFFQLQENQWFLAGYEAMRSFASM